jgi:hypothetical protein
MRGQPWRHRRLRVRPGGRRTSAAARLRAHEVALGAWEAALAAASGWRGAVAASPLALRVYIMRRPLAGLPPDTGGRWGPAGVRWRDAALEWARRAEVAADGWAAAARRWA